MLDLEDRITMLTKLRADFLLNTPQIVPVCGTQTSIYVREHTCSLSVEKHFPRVYKLNLENDGLCSIFTIDVDYSCKQPSCLSPSQAASVMANAQYLGCLDVFGRVTIYNQSGYVIVDLSLETEPLTQVQERITEVFGSPSKSDKVVDDYNYMARLHGLVPIVDYSTRIQSGLTVDMALRSHPAIISAIEDFGFSNKLKIACVFDLVKDDKSCGLRHTTFIPEIVLRKIKGSTWLGIRTVDGSIIIANQKFGPMIDINLVKQPREVYGLLHQHLRHLGAVTKATYPHMTTLDVRNCLYDTGLLGLASVSMRLKFDKSKIFTTRVPLVVFISRIWNLYQGSEKRFGLFDEVRAHGVHLNKKEVRTLNKVCDKLYECKANFK